MEGEKNALHDPAEEIAIATVRESSCEIKGKPSGKGRSPGFYEESF